MFVFENYEFFFEVNWKIVIYKVSYFDFKMFMNFIYIIMFFVVYSNCGFKSLIFFFVLVVLNFALR